MVATGAAWCGMVARDTGHKALCPVSARHTAADQDLYMMVTGVLLLHAAALSQASGAVGTPNTTFPVG